MTRSAGWRRISSVALVVSGVASCTLLWPFVPASAADLESATVESGCAPLPEAEAATADGLLPAQSLAQGNVFDHGPPRSILLVSSRPDALTSVVDPAAEPIVSGVDLSSNVLVALFIGRWPQEGHRVTIESVRTTDAGVCLTASVTGPDPGQDAADAETYPYHVVSVPLAAIPQVPGTAWTAVSPDGAVIATTRYP